MKETTLAETVTALATPLARSLELEIWGIELMFGGRSLIRIFVEGENGVNIDKCAELSRLLGLTLEVEDIVPGAYVLEVSSPGLERTFFKPEQLTAYSGKILDVSLHAPSAAYPGRKRFMGELVKAQDAAFSLLPFTAEGVKDETAPLLDFTWEDAKKIKLVHFLPQPSPGNGGKKPQAPSKGKSKNAGKGKRKETNAAAHATGDGEPA